MAKKKKTTSKRSRRHVDHDEEDLVQLEDEDQVRIQVQDFKIEFPIRVLTGFERDSVLHRLDNEEQPNLSDLSSSDGSLVPIAVLEIEDVHSDDSKSEYVPLIQDVDTAPVKTAQAGVPVPDSGSSRRNRRKIRPESPMKDKDPDPIKSPIKEPVSVQKSSSRETAESYVLADKIPAPAQGLRRSRRAAAMRTEVLYDEILDEELPVPVRKVRGRVRPKKRAESPIPENDPIAAVSPNKVVIIEEPQVVEEEVIAIPLTEQKPSKEYSPTKMQEVHTLIQPQNDVMKNRLAARNSDNRIRKSDVSSNFLELQRQREEAKRIAKAVEVKEEKGPEIGHTASSLPIEKTEVLSNDKKRMIQVANDDDDWAATAPAAIRPPSKIPKPLAPPSARKERRSMVMITAKAAVPQIVPKIEPKRTFATPGKPAGQIANFKIPKKISRGPDEKQHDWSKDWKSATVSQNWGSTTTTATAEETNSAPVPVAPVNGYSSLLNKPQYPKRNAPNLGYKPSWALSETDGTTGVQSDTADGSGWAAEEAKEVPAIKSDDADGWNDNLDQAITNSTTHPAATAIKPSVSLWPSGDEPQVPAAAPPAEDDGWN